MIGYIPSVLDDLKLSNDATAYLIASSVTTPDVMYQLYFELFDLDLLSLSSVSRVVTKLLSNYLVSSRRLKASPFVSVKVPYDFLSDSGLAKKEL